MSCRCRCRCCRRRRRLASHLPGAFQRQKQAANKSAALSAVFLRRSQTGEGGCCHFNRCNQTSPAASPGGRTSFIQQVEAGLLVATLYSTVQLRLQQRLRSLCLILFCLFFFPLKQNLGLSRDTTDIFWTRHFLDTTCLKGFRRHITVIKLKCKQTRKLLPLLH